MPAIVGPVALWGNPSRAGDRCSDDQEFAAEKEAAYLDDWAAIYRSYQRYRQCDDGAIAEGYSESISKTLQRHWATVSQLQRLTSKDKRFEKFILLHVDETVSGERLQAIDAKARTHCPAHALTLCRSIAETIKEVQESAGK